MSEIKFYRQELQVQYNCDTCKSGYMYPTGGFSKDGNKTLFEHSCERKLMSGSKCKNINLNRVYPATEVEFVLKETNDR